MARIKVDLDRTHGTINPMIYGGFIEHLGRCIYGGIYEEGSPLADARGFRTDVLEAVRALRVPILRWPGGNFVSGYHWMDGVGPKERRPRKMELAWHTEESNRFGTAEFIEYCRAIGAEPYICVNLGTGTLDEAQAWVEYCNGTGNTYYANLRREHGYEEPFNVKYWGLGNEMYGSWQIGAKTAEEYARFAVEAAKLMKWTDPSIKLVSCGHNGLAEWDRIVLEKLARYVEYHSIHLYTGSSDPQENVAHPLVAEQYIAATQALIDEVRYRQRIAHPIKIAFDEWNVWYRARGRETRLEERYDFSDALAVAVYLNVFQRNCRSVEIANLAQLVNVIAPIFTSPDGLFLQTIYHPLKLYVDHSGSVSIDAWVDCATYASGKVWGREIPVLDVSCTYDPDERRCTLAVVNRALEPETTEIAIFGGVLDSAPKGAPGDAQRGVRVGETELEAEIYALQSSDPHACNDFDRPNALAPTTARAKVGTRFSYTFPPFSLTLIKVAL